MKIYPNLTVITGQKTYPRRVRRSEEDASFGQVLETAETKEQRSRDIVEVISLENKRALSQEPPQDLTAAEAVLARVTENLGQMSKDELKNIHRLEGLVHFYMP